MERTVMATHRRGIARLEKERSADREEDLVANRSVKASVLNRDRLVPKIFAATAKRRAGLKNDYDVSFQGWR